MTESFATFLVRKGLTTSLKTHPKGYLVDLLVTEDHPGTDSYSYFAGWYPDWDRPTLWIRLKPGHGTDYAQEVLRDIRMTIL